jgi:hypothetical protein
MALPASAAAFRSIEPGRRGTGLGQGASSSQYRDGDPDSNGQHDQGAGKTESGSLQGRTEILGEQLIALHMIGHGCAPQGRKLTVAGVMRSEFEPSRAAGSSAARLGKSI